MVKSKTRNTRKPVKAKTKPVTKQANLYPTNVGRIGKARPRYTYVGDTKVHQTSYTRNEQLRIARSLFATCPDLGGAIISKASWVAGPGTFTPIYTGENTAWGDKAEAWLINNFYPYCSINGPNYPFQKILELTSIALDVDGDTGMFLTKTRDGLPRVGLLPSHRIGQRETYLKQVSTGRYAGNDINDGVITNKAGFPVAYRILGDKPEDDYDISISSFSFLYDAEWADQYRGISRIARSILDWQDQDDINEFIKRNIKLASSIGLKVKTTDGTGNNSGFNVPSVGLTEDAITPTATGVDITAIQGGELYFMNSLNGEEIEVLDNKNPSAETEKFIERIQARALYSVQWPKELLDSSKIGGAAVRLVQDLVRKTIANRQMVVERRARLIVNYALANAMELGLIPQNKKDWASWTFSKGSVLTCDNGYEASADRAGYILGTTTLSEIASKKNLDPYTLQQQTLREKRNLVDNAQTLAAEKNIPFETALTLLSSIAPNQQPVMTPPAEATITADTN